MKYTPITEKILTHKKAYQDIGMEVPPYRITPVEHKQLLVELDDLTEMQKRDRIVNYYGTHLQLVVIVEDYGLK